MAKVGLLNMRVHVVHTFGKHSQQERVNHLAGFLTIFMA